MPMHGKKKKSKMMARGGYGTPTRKMKMRAGGATKKTKDTGNKVARKVGTMKDPTKKIRKPESKFAAKKGENNMPMHGKKKKSKMMARGGMKKKSKMMAKGGMKKSKMMARGGMKKTKSYARGGAARRK